MSEPQTGSDTLGSQALPQETTEFGQDVLDSIQAISRPVEMANLSTLKPVDPTNSSHAPVREGEEFDNETDRTGTAETSRSEGNVQPTTANAPPNSQVDSAIGPSTDKPTRIRSGSGSGPQLIIVLLLHSTHTRHPYTINDKYLKKRNVSVADNDPINMSVYTLKELIWRDWREGTRSLSLDRVAAGAYSFHRMGGSSCKPNLYQINPYGWYAR